MSSAVRRPDDEPPRLLALDTSTEWLSVAVVAGAQTFAAHEAGGPRASQRLLPLAFELLGRAGLCPSALQAVAFGRGPGAFTGLRTACATAQGLALGLGCPLLALDSLALVAEDARQRHGASALWVAMDARMDEAYAAPYVHADGAWQARRAPALYTLDALRDALAHEPLPAVAGSALTAFGAQRLPTPGARRLDDDSLADRAAALARLARTAWAHGQTIDAAEALPLYLRDKVALTSAERAAARDAAAAA